MLSRFTDRFAIWFVVILFSGAWYHIFKIKWEGKEKGRAPIYYYDLMKRLTVELI